MARDLENAASSLIEDLVREIEDFDLVTLREDINDRAHEAAESACIYYHDCADIISRYETDPRADTESADDAGGTFKPSEYQQAMAAYAFFIARSIIEAEASDIVDKIEEAADDLEMSLSEPDDPRLPRELPDRDTFRLSADCLHGWAAHDSEDAAGGCYWLSRQLDGCNAIAIPAGPVWVSYTWTPK